MLARSPRLGAALALCCAALAVLPAAASAELTIVVNTTADQAPAPGQCSGVPGDCSLRQAVDKANDEPGADTIVLAALRYELTIPGSEEEQGATGDLDVYPGGLRVEGAGASRTTVAAAAAIKDRVFDLETGSELTLVGATVSGGDVLGESGGGIRARQGSLTLRGVAITDNVQRESGAGAGLGLLGSETTIVDSLVAARNRASGNGGGIYAAEGGLQVENSTIANNQADTSLYPGDPARGAYGGGVELQEGEKFTLRSVTIAGNSIHDGVGGSTGEAAAIYGDPESSEIVNTIVWGNTGTGVQKANQCESTFATLGHNVEQPVPGEPPCFTGPSIITADPLLGPLALNGGETETMALGAGSSAIDSGALAQCPATDQRGFARPQNGSCDVGAFEAAHAPPGPPAPPVTPAAPKEPAISHKGKLVVRAAGKRFRVWPGIRVACPASGPRCTGTLLATARLGGASSRAARPVRIGKARFGIAPGRSKALAVGISRRASVALTEAGRLRVSFTVSARAGGNGVAKKTFQATLKPPQPGRK